MRAARDAMVEADTVIAANRMLGYLGPVLRWAAQEDLIPANFVPAIRRAPEEKRSRVLTKKEIAKIWKACGDLGSARGGKELTAALVRFLLVTAQRRDEAASLRFGHILDGTWRQADEQIGSATQPHAAAARQVTGG